jgi:hypothetical protein
MDLLKGGLEPAFYLSSRGFPIPIALLVVARPSEYALRGFLLPPVRTYTRPGATVLLGPTEELEDLLVHL